MRFVRPLRLIIEGNDVSEIWEARGPMGRFLGLMGRSRPLGAGLLFTRCSSVHTCFMRFAIEVVYLDDACRVIKIANVRPWRFTAARGARSVLELPLGASAHFGITVGTRLEVAP